MELDNTDTTTKSFLIDYALSEFGKLHPISKELHDEVHRCAYLKMLKDGEIFVAQGQYCREFFFVCHGLLIYNSIHNGKMFTTAFCKTGDYGTSISGLYGRQPSDDHIYSFGDTLLMVINTDDMERWYGIYPAVNIIMRQMFEQNLKVAHGRANLIRMGTAKQKYAYYKKKKPEYVDTVPLEVIASFLGMKPSTLEQIIKEEEKTEIKELESELVYERLLGYIDASKPYLNDGLTLRGLAVEVELNTHQLSELINRKSHKNFSDFINGYRVAYVIQQLSNWKEWKHLKLETLGKQAGFKSRSSFFSVFKKHMGKSPSIFLEESQNS